MIAAGMAETFRGQAWSKNCREWVYFNCFIDIASVRLKFSFAACVNDHVHRGTHDGRERGLVCSSCWDGVMGVYEAEPGLAVFYG